MRPVAAVAELADAHDSGSCARKGVVVRLHSAALFSRSVRAGYLFSFRREATTAADSRTIEFMQARAGLVRWPRCTGPHHLDKLWDRTLFSLGKKQAQPSRTHPQKNTALIQGGVRCLSRYN